MIQAMIGEPIGVEHETRYDREGNPVLLHHLQRAVTTTAQGIHSPSTGTIHQLRDYVTEADGGFLWRTRCGQGRIRLDANGVCRDAVPAQTTMAFCHHCGSCTSIAEKTAAGELYRQRVAVWKAKRAQRQAAFLRRVGETSA